MAPKRTSHDRSGNGKAVSKGDSGGKGRGQSRGRGQGRGKSDSVENRKKQAFLQQTLDSVIYKQLHVKPPSKTVKKSAVKSKAKPKGRNFLTVSKTMTLR